MKWSSIILSVCCVVNLNAFDPFGIVISGVSYIKSVVDTNERIEQSEIEKPLSGGRSSEISRKLIKLVDSHEKMEDPSLDEEKVTNNVGGKMSLFEWFSNTKDEKESSTHNVIMEKRHPRNGMTKEDRLFGKDVTSVVLSMNEKDLANLAKLVIEMEVLSVLPTLRISPYVLHGLLQNSPEDMIKFNRDTSHGYFGFTLGTFGDTYAILKLKDENGESMISRDKQRIIRIQNDLIQTFDIPNLPFPQIASFYGLVQGWFGSFKNNVAAARHRRLNKVEYAYIPDKYQKDVRFNFICVFYRFYNGQLSQSKVTRLVSSYEKYFL